MRSISSIRSQVVFSRSSAGGVERPHPQLETGRPPVEVGAHAHGSRVDVRDGLQPAQRDIADRLQPHRLPDAGHRGVPDPLRVEQLLAAGL